MAVRNLPSVQNPLELFQNRLLSGARTGSFSGSHDSVVFLPFQLETPLRFDKRERLHLLRERRTRRRSKQGLRLQSSGARPSRTRWTFSSKAARSPLHRATSFLCMWTAGRSAPPRSRVPSGPSSKRYCGSSSCHCGRRSEETAALRQQQRLERSPASARGTTGRSPGSGRQSSRVSVAGSDRRAITMPWSRSAMPTPRQAGVKPIIAAWSTAAGSKPSGCDASC